MSSRTLLAGAVLLACLGVTGCTGRQILSMREHPEKPNTSTPAPGAPAAAFTGPALAATTDYPKNPNAPRPEPPADFASMKNPLPASPDNIAKGKVLFTGNCAPCHGAAGAGDGPAAAGGELVERAAQLPVRTCGHEVGHQQVRLPGQRVCRPAIEDRPRIARNQLDGAIEVDDGVSILAGGHERVVHDKDERVSRIVEHALAKA